MLSPNLLHLIERRGYGAAHVVHAYIEMTGGGAYLGAWEGVRSGRQVPILSDARAAVCVLGGPGSGKTRAIMKPAVAAHPGPVVSVSTKPEVLVDTLTARQMEGRVYVLDLSGESWLAEGVIELRWSPVLGADDYDIALLRAHQMTKASNPGASDATARHFNDKAANLLAAFLHAAALGGRAVADVLRWAQEGETQVPADYLPPDAVAVSALRGITRMGDNERGGVLSTTARVLAAYQSRAAVRTATAPQHGKAACWLAADGFALSDADTLYVISPKERGEFLAPLVVGVLNDIQQAVFRQSAEIVRNKLGEKRWPPVLFALDECANIAPIPDLPSMLSEAGGQGLQLLTVFQDTAQMSRLWPADAAGMLSLFGALLVLPGIKNRETLELLSLLVGDQEQERSSISHARSRGDSRHRRDANLLGLATSRSRQRTQTVTTSTEWRREIPPEQIAQMPQGVGLLWRGASYQWVPLAWWDQHPVWRQMTV